MNKEQLISSASRLGYPLVGLESRRLTKNQIIEVLGELANTRDVRLLEGFPVVLANCAQQHPHLDMKTLLSSYEGNNIKHRNLEKALLVGWSLLKEKNFPKPKNLDQLAEALKKKYRGLLTGESILLRRGVVLSKERLRNALRRYGTSLADSSSVRDAEKSRQRLSFLLNLDMRTIFSQKQRELVFKKLRGESLTKTEQEYYSRVVKKKLKALANSEVRRIASKLTRE